jgi:D-threonate/D-erythronate kinase
LKRRLRRPLRGAFGDGGGPAGRQLRRVGVLADDLTGAGDAAAAFAARGFRAEISLRRAGAYAKPSRGAEVWILDTDSRHAPPAEAARRVRAAVKALRRWRPGFVFKKVDSALRGPVAVEMEAFLAGLPSSDKPCAFVPAFPRMGRTTRCGVQRVFGVPVHRTAFGRDPLSPVKTSSIGARLGAAVKACWVPDAATAADMRRAARVIGGAAARADAAAGSAGLAEELARLWRPQGVPLRLPPSLSGPVMVLAGSRHPVTRGQVAWLRRRRAGRILDLTGPLDSATKSQSILLAASPEAPGRPENVMAGLLRRAVPAARRFKVRSYVATGGETAGRFCAAMGWRRLRVLGRVDTGVPLCAPAEAPAARLALKPGAFGKPDALAGAARALTHA